MTDIEAKAQALLMEARKDRGAHPITHEPLNRAYIAHEALCRAIEQHEATTKEIERLNGVIIATADHWLALQTEHPIAWEGAIDEAMAAACAKICELTEQHEAFKQEVSDEVHDYRQEGRPEIYFGFDRFIIPKPKPDPLEEVLMEIDHAAMWVDKCAEEIRASLGARGWEIREKGR